MTARPIYEPTPEEIRQATEAYRADPERWPKELRMGFEKEIVTGDDAVREQQDRQIVLRVENVDAVFTLQKGQVYAEALKRTHRR